MRRRQWGNLFLICVLTVFAVSFLGAFTPQIQASMVADNFVIEITGLPFQPWAVDVDSSGNVFVRDTDANAVWRSSDNGVTWSKAFQGIWPSPTSRISFVFVDSRDYIFASMWKTGTKWYVYRSTDGGDSWEIVLDDAYQMWHMTEDPSGNLYINTYTNEVIYIYRSTDTGDSFHVWRNQTGKGDHFHTVGVDISNGDVYTAMGDFVDWIQRWNGSSWSNVTTTIAVTDIWSDNSYVYFGFDAGGVMYRIPSGGTWAEREAVWDSYGAPRVDCPIIEEGSYYGDADFHVFGDCDGHVCGSWDGQHWVKLVDTGDGNESFYSISHRLPVYVTERTKRRLWRIDIAKEDLIKLYHKEYYKYRGNEVNAQNYVLEQRISNGSNYIDFTGLVLSNVQASIIGLSRYNHYNNSGFETGDKTSWTEAQSPFGTVKSGSSANGTYYYARNHTTQWECLTQGFISGSLGDVYILSFYYKGNASVDDALQIQYQYNGGSQENWRDGYIDVTKNWQRFTTAFVHADSSKSAFRWWILFRINKPLETHLDSLMFVKLEVGIARGVSEGDSIQFLEKESASAYHNQTLNTTYPTLTINGQQVSHDGMLTNGTRSPSTNLTGILTGPVQVLANIQESEQAILRITGTRLFYEDSTILRERTNDIYVGRYYGSFSPTTSTNDLIVVTNLAATVSSASATNTKLCFTLTCISGLTTITKVYCGDRGEPLEIYTVNGTSEWCYNSDTTILTLNVTHESPTRILIYWKFPGDVNDDEIVDVCDLSRICKAYGATPSSLNWDEVCDINGDEIIDSHDLTICIENYGKSQ